MDAINQRYSRKRALYLAGLARHLSFAKCVGSLHYSCLHGNRLRPVLLLKPPGKMVGTVVCGQIILVLKLIAFSTPFSFAVWNALIEAILCKKN